MRAGENWFELNGIASWSSWLRGSISLIARYNARLMDKMSGHIEIRAVAAECLIDLRHAVLRKGLPRETAMFAGDEDASSRHFVAEGDGVVVGCVTLHLNEWAHEPAWQLRGMAVAETHQGRGIGSKLLMAVEQSIARTPAALFYGRHGWQVVSEEFEIPTAGPHVKMMKRLGMKDEG